MNEYVNRILQVNLSTKRIEASDFDALEWLAAMGSHVLNKAEQMVRYYGCYSNVSRGKRGKLNLDEAVPCILEPEQGTKKYRKNWARLIQKIYEVDPLRCPKCQGRMKIISQTGLASPIP